MRGRGPAGDLCKHSWNRADPAGPVERHPMIESDFNRTPSDDLAELGGQLVRELSRLDEPNPEEPELFRAYVQHAQVLAWQGVADGRMGAPREALSCLQAAQPFVDHHLPDLSPTAAAA